MQNKDEAHIVLLPTMTREALKQLILLEVLDNDNKLITPQMVRRVFNALVDSVINWQDDTVDLRSYNTEILTAIDNQTEFTLQFIPINPDKDMQFTVDGIDQQYGVDFTVVDNILTFIPNTEWTIKATMRVAVKYRYFTVTSSGGTGGGTGGNTGGFNFIEVAIASQTNITITHNLGRLPISISIYQSLGAGEFELVNTEVIATNTTITVDFGVSFTGKLLFI
jgi:hypothetical protein